MFCSSASSHTLMHPCLPGQNSFPASSLHLQLIKLHFPSKDVLQGSGSWNSQARRMERIKNCSWNRCVCSVVKFKTVVLVTPEQVSVCVLGLNWNWTVVGLHWSCRRMRNAIPHWNGLHCIQKCCLKKRNTHRGPKPLTRMFTVKVNCKAVKSML